MGGLSANAWANPSTKRRRRLGPGDAVGAIREVEGLGGNLGHGQGVDIAGAGGEGGRAGVLDEEETDRHGRGRGRLGHRGGDLGNRRAGAERSQANGGRDAQRPPG